MTAPLGRSANIRDVPTTDTKSLIEGAIARFIDEVPALRTLAVVIRLELRERGGPAVWRVELPAKTAKRDPAADSSIELTIDRQAFNQLATKGRLDDWIGAFDKGVLRTQGDPNILRLVGKVVEMRRARLK
jgi:hypothetical protein